MYDKENSNRKFASDSSGPPQMDFLAYQIGYQLGFSKERENYKHSSIV